MRGSLYMMIAMASMMGGGYSNPRQSYSPKYKPMKELTEEEKQAQFLMCLEKLNSERKKEFPKFKEFQVHGLFIIAFSQKNAVRDMERLMRENYIAIKTESDVQVQG